MENFDSVTNGILLISGGGATFRVILCLLKIMTEPDQADKYKARIKNCMIFVAILVGVYYLKDIAIGYFK